MGVDFSQVRDDETDEPTGVSTCDRCGEEIDDDHYADMQAHDDKHRKEDAALAVKLVDDMKDNPRVQTLNEQDLKGDEWHRFGPFVGANASPPAPLFARGDTVMVHPQGSPAFLSEVAVRVLMPGGDWAYRVVDPSPGYAEIGTWLERALSDPKNTPRWATEPGRPDTDLTPFGAQVVQNLRGAADTFAERAAVYKDNYTRVGDVIAGLFPNGAPALGDADSYNRWHLFELAIVKLTRYAVNYSAGHDDSLSDMIVYLSMVQALDRQAGRG